MRGVSCSLLCKKYYKFILVAVLLVLAIHGLFIWRPSGDYNEFNDENAQTGMTKIIEENENVDDSSVKIDEIKPENKIDENPELKKVESIGNFDEPTTKFDDYDSSRFKEVSNEKSWFFKDGTRYPEPATISKKTGVRATALLPFEQPDSDRIINQLLFVPPNYDKTKSKSILVPNGIPSWWDIQPGNGAFQGCPVDACRVTVDSGERQTADMVFFHEHFVRPFEPRPAKQIYALYHLESPYHTGSVPQKDSINWTITYRHDSTIVASYAKWSYYDPRVKQIEQTKNYAAKKTKKVAWFVSNCGARNNRLKYAQELQKYIQVDIYGSCGTMSCPRSQGKKCDHLLDSDYKFYLAFENSNCKSYITEKFFYTGLLRDVLPIVMGAPPEDYEKYAPMRSYIHVDDFESPKQLAEYLHVLDQNDDLYNSYFKWRGTGEIIPANMWCRICAMLHDEYSTKSRWYPDVNEWWGGQDVCTTETWREFKKTHKKIPF